MNTSILRLSAVLLLLAGPLAACGASDSPDNDGGADEGSSTGGADDAMSDDSSDGATDPNATSADDDGSTGGESTEPGTGSSGEEVEDTTPPTVVSSIPASGETGVFADVIMTIEFSEPMDTASVETAYYSADLPDPAVAMNWNDAGDQLIITPLSELPYGSGVSALDITPQAIALSVTTAATDLAGNELEQDFDLEFTMLNLIREEIGLLGSMSGSIRADGLAQFGMIRAGDAGNPPNARYRGIASFPIDDLSPDIAEFVDATLLSTQYETAGSPYTDLGELELHQVAFDSISAAFETPSEGLLGVLADSGANGQHALHVTAAVQASYDAGADMTQFAYQFPLATDFDGTADYAEFHATNEPATLLRVDYLVP